MEPMPAPETSEDARRFAGAQKAAAILLAMGKPPATRLLKHLEPNELREVTRAAARLGAVSARRRWNRWSRSSPALSRPARACWATSAEPATCSSDAVSAGRGRGHPFRRLDARRPGVWNTLGGVPESVLQGYLANEHPLVATYILSKLAPPLAAQVVARMPREARNEVLVAMIVRPVISEDIQLIVEDGVRKDLANLSARSAGLDNHTRIADIINNLEPLDARDVVQSLVAARPKEARMVMKMLFSFDDLPRLSQRARAVLFDKLQTETVVMALRGADAEFRDAVLSAMASRSKRLVESELATPMLASPRDIAKARKQITDLVLKMAQRNEIEIPPPDGAEAA